MDIPQPSHPFLHRTPAQTRFNDYDLLGHLNNNIYLVLADMGKAGYFRDAAPHLWDWHTHENKNMHTHAHPNAHIYT